MKYSQKPTKTYSLKFQNKNLEIEYEKSRRKSQEKAYIWFSRLCFGIISIMGAYRMIFVATRQAAPEIIRLALTASLIILNYFARRKMQKINMIPACMSAIFLINIICELESTKETMKRDDWNSAGIFISSFQIATLQVLVFVFNLHWFESWLLLLILQGYVIVRFNFTPMSKTLHETIQQVSWCIGILLISALLLFSKELSYRLKFYENMKGKQYLEFFHELFKNNIPNPIIIAKSVRVDEDEVIFANKASENLLGTSSKEEMLEKINQFTFSQLESGKENSKRCESENMLLIRNQLRFWNMLRDKSFKEKSLLEGGFKEYQAILETNAPKKFIEPLSKIKVCHSKMVVDEGFNLKSTNRIHKQNRSFNSNRMIPLRSESSDSDSASSEDDSILAFAEKKNNLEKLKGVRFFSVKIGKVDWDNASDATLFIFQEVTDNVVEANNKATQILDRNKNRLLATVSHQMRTPLNAIISSVDSLLPMFDHDKTTKKQIKLCWRSAQLLNYSIGNIIDLSKISNRTFSPEISITPGVPLVQAVLKLIEFKAKLKKLRLESSIQILAPFYLVCDQERLKQILLNLLENSIKYTDPGGRVAISVTIENIQKLKKSLDLNSEDIHCEERGFSKALSYENAKHYAKFVIEDSGRGIEGYKLPKLFKLFSELEDGQTSEISEGIGLGLALSQYLLKKMLPKHLAKEGLIKVQSITGKGSTFSFFIPVETMRKKRNSESNLVLFPRISAESHEKMKLSRQSKANFPLAVENKEDKLHLVKALIVDDDQINQLVVKNYLEKLGITNIEKADNGKEALDLVIRFASKGSPFNLVLMDCNMPIMNGYEATKRIREQEQAGLIPPLKIIAITANVASNDWDRCREAGMNSYLTKPLNKNTFRETLERHLDIKLEVPELTSNENACTLEKTKTKN